MRKSIHLSAACALLPLLACSDATMTEDSLLAPEEGARAGWVSGPPPDAPPELQRSQPDISNVIFTTRIGGGWAETVAAADFWTTDAEVWAKATVLDAAGHQIGSDEDFDSHHSWYLATPTVAAVAAYPIFSDCGLKNYGKGKWGAWFHFGSKKWGAFEFRDRGTASLPACSCSSTDFAEPDYDPDNPDCQSSSSGSGDSLGKKMQPGQYTGGQTVDWSTGRLDGGRSVCGSLAVVDYVCIYYWKGGQKKLWGCGYVTTC